MPLNAELVSFIEESFDRTHDSILEQDTANCLHKAIVDHLDLLLNEQGIPVPYRWNTFSILEEGVVNNDQLWKNVDFLFDIVCNLTQTNKYSWWFEAAVEFLKFASSGG